MLDLQDRVADWVVSTFGEGVQRDVKERTHRFLEEALELAQANGCDRKDALALVDYVFNRPVGELDKELGGVMLTLAALSHATGYDAEACAENELFRVKKLAPQIREKWRNKPRLGPLPFNTQVEKSQDDAL